MGVRYWYDFVPNSNYTTTFLTLFFCGIQLVQHIHAGSNICFKGDDSEAIVLCTDDATYSVKVGTDKLDNLGSMGYVTMTRSYSDTSTVLIQTGCEYIEYAVYYRCSGHRNTKWKKLLFFK